ncbi:MAG: FAD:protein FMN transferase [Clostridia bacterium]
MKKIFIILIFLLSLTACQAKYQEQSADFFAMDTYMSITATSVEPSGAIAESQTAIFNLESMISRTNENSDIYKLNNSNGEAVEVSDTTYEILEIALEIAELTDGAFDPTICAITDLWGIGTENARVPSEEEIEKALETVSYKNIILLGDNKVQLLNGAQIDLGAVGKGYAADMVVDIYKENDVVCGVISLAGNIYTYGQKEDGSLWNIGVTDPDDTTQVNISVQTTDTSIVTTGAYERYFEEDGVIYHHIFDSKTGYPTTQNIKSVTVISESSTLADIYATALFAMGFDNAIAFAQSIEEIDVIIIKDDDTVYYSDNLNVTLGDKYAG